MALERTERVIVIADGSKVGAATQIVVGPADRVATLVTDPSAPAARARSTSAQLGVEVVIAERAAPAPPETAGRAIRLAVRRA